MKVDKHSEQKQNDLDTLAHQYHLVEAYYLVRRIIQSYGTNAEPRNEKSSRGDDQPLSIKRES